MLPVWPDFRNLSNQTRNPFPEPNSIWNFFGDCHLSTDLTDSTAESESEAQKLTLQVDIDKVNACRRHVRVTVARTDIDRYFQERFEKLLPEAEVPGFRAGKAPRTLVESRFRKQVSEQVKGALLMDSLAQINEADHFSAISEPDLDYEKVEVPDSGDFKFEFDIEVRPDFVTPEWKGIKLKRPEKEISDADIDNYIGQISRSKSVLVPVDAPAKAGDTVVCEIRSTFEGNQVSHCDETPIRVRPMLSFADSEIDGFDKLMIGAKAGDTRTAEVKISEYADSTDYQGKTLTVDFTVLDVKREEKADRAEIAEKFEFQSAGDLVDFVKKQLQSQLEYDQRQSIRNQISQRLTESADWELPPELLKKQFRRELQRAQMELKSSGFSPEDIRNHENRLRQDAMRRTEVLLKEHFILERIAEEQKVEDSPEDYDREIDRMAASSNESARRVRAKLDRNGQIDVLRNMIIERKVIDMITENAKFEAVAAETDAKRGTIEAVEFAVAGEQSSDIPDAKYEEQTQQPIPGTATAITKKDKE